MRPAPTTSRNRTREREIAEISSACKQLALSLGLATILIAQLNRQVEARQNKRPMLSDLRESGSLEADADKVLMLFRPGYYDTRVSPAKTEIIVPKHRGGETGVVHCRFDAPCGRFYEAQRSVPGRSS